MLRYQNFPLYSELRKFNKDIYLLSNKLPAKEQYELGAQLRRASSSVILNLAEGSMKKSDKEFSRFLLISIGSLSEIVAILDICSDLQYISSLDHTSFVLKCETFLKKLYSFRKRISN